MQTNSKKKKAKVNLNGVQEGSRIKIQDGGRQYFARVLAVDFSHKLVDCTVYTGGGPETRHIPFGYVVKVVRP